MSEARVEGIFIGPERELPAPVERVRAIAGSGLEGNRYFYESAPPGRALTLIAAEAIESFADETGIPLTAAESRRNVLTRNATFGAGTYPSNPLASFNQPTAVGDPRSVQLGVRVRF